MSYFSPILKEILERHEFTPRKRWGQNFLVDQRVLGNIVDAADIHKEDAVVEIGPGLGALTVLLAEKAGQVFAVELDRKLCAILQEILVACKNVQIIQDDIIRVDLNALLKGHTARQVKVVANLPYYMTTQILMYLLESKFPIHELVVMVQKEVAERMMANPGGKTYGSLSVAVQYYSKPEIVLDVPPGAFIPRPEVTSSVIKLTVRDAPPVRPRDEDLFFQVVRAAFSKRRKTLTNALLQEPALFLTREKLAPVMAHAGIDGMRRGETLSLEEFSRLSDEMAKLPKSPRTKVK